MQNAIMGGALKGIPVVNLDKLDPVLAEGVKEIDVSDMRAPYFGANADDLRSAWSLSVPGK